MLLSFRKSSSDGEKGCNEALDKHVRIFGSRNFCETWDGYCVVCIIVFFLILAKSLYFSDHCDYYNDFQSR
jgi:hypothetical protein